MLDNILLVLRDLLFPPRCAVCGKGIGIPSKGFLCTDCNGTLAVIESPMCTVCGQPFKGPEGSDHVCGQCLVHPPPFDKARSMFYYRDAARTLIHLIKFRGDGYALKALAAESRKHLSEMLVGIGMVVPVPLYPVRLRTRGFNQCLRLAEAVFPESTISTNLLIRKHDTLPQTGLSLKERQKNVSGAFESSGVPEDVENILLLDDVYTTGSTVKACSRVLKKAGIKRVQVLTFARTVPGTDLAG